MGVLGLALISSYSACSSSIVFEKRASSFSSFLEGSRGMEDAGGGSFDVGKQQFIKPQKNLQKTISVKGNLQAIWAFKVGSISFFNPLSF